MELWKGEFNEFAKSECYCSRHWRALSSSITDKGCHNCKTLENCYIFYLWDGLQYLIIKACYFLYDYLVFENQNIIMFVAIDRYCICTVSQTDCQLLNCLCNLN